MSTIVEISREAFEVLVADNEPYTTTSGDISTMEHYSVKGVLVGTVTNHCDQTTTRYYIQDINAEEVH